MTRPKTKSDRETFSSSSASFHTLIDFLQIISTDDPNSGLLLYPNLHLRPKSVTGCRKYWRFSSKVFGKNFAQNWYVWKPRESERALYWRSGFKIAGSYFVTNFYAPHVNARYFLWSLCEIKWFDAECNTKCESIWFMDHSKINWKTIHRKQNDAIKYSALWFPVWYI